MKQRTIRAILIFAAFCLLPGLAGCDFSEIVETPHLPARVLARYAYDYPETERPSLFACHNVLVISPHQDDEVSILGGVFEQYIAAGSTLRVLFVTNGDYYGLAEVRYAEAIAALGAVGVPRENVLFLGYGDGWDTPYKHIYHAPAGEPVRSQAGYTETHGTSQAEAFHAGTPYTRNNLKSDLRAVIETYAPDTIYCIDFDQHSDHRATSLLFEELMGELLGEDPAYRPTVFKSFTYSISWDGARDFYADNIRSTVNDDDLPYMREVNYYNWAERVRFPVSKAALGRLQGSASSVYGMLEAYPSQRGLFRGRCVINGDRVCFLRETESLLYAATVTASSGNAAPVNDFKIVDSADIVEAVCVFSGHVWSPDAGDTVRSLQIALPAPETLSSLVFYDNPSFSDNVLDMTVVFSDGSELTTGPLQANGAATRISFEPKENISGFSIRLDETEGETAGLAELEAYAETPDHGLRWIKLMNAQEDFVYDYWLEGGAEETLYLYAFPGADGSLESEYTLELEGSKKCSARFENDGIAIRCPAGCSMLLTVRSREYPDVCDAVRVSNPLFFTRLTYKFFELWERASDL